ncbi:hypothetical protein [Lentzea sp. NEAU-D7]|uniref:hypothetical protein n=1 Tax=Lentzea sp. NEAU-D7 TaxID=2994667 RepID=UPI00224AD83B|nr:hypothetical protein [Lentzea sp. NEAU-D7]MCX2950194.1 hypothetical protein [Lentzea sp. NEAU-D7]
MRRWLWGLVSAVLASAAGVFINLATDSDSKPWTWFVVVALTLLIGALTARAVPSENGRDDVETLRDVTEANLRALADHSGLPARGVGRSRVDRAELEELLRTERSFVITGEPGSGKSGALYGIAESLRQRGEDVVLLTVETLGEAAGAVRGDVTLTRPALEVLNGWQSEERGTLLIDGLDASRQGSLTWLANLVGDLNGSRWRTIATMRSFDLRYAQVWRNAFAGVPISARRARRDPELRDVRHVVLGDFAAEDLERLALEDATVRALVEYADEDFLQLIRNPFNLRLACQLLPSAEPVAARDRLDLLQRYWRRRVLDQPDGEERGRVLGAVSQEMVRQRALRVRSSIIPESSLAARRAVLRDGVLRESPARLALGGADMLVFSHHVLFDYAVAALLLAEGDRSRLRDALDGDPNLVLVARPSIDLHLAAVWHADRTRQVFAEVVIGLAEAGHSIAGLAAASVLVRETRRGEDLRWLIELPAGPAYCAIIGWIAGVMSAAEDRVKKRVRGVLALWASILATAGTSLADEFDHDLASQSLRLMHALDDLDPLGPGVSGAEERALFLVQLMTASLQQPAEREWYGQQVARYLPRALGVSPEPANVLRRTLAPEVISGWLTRYLEFYVDNVALIATTDAQLAEDVLLSSWRLHDNSEEITSVLRGVVAITSTRNQDIGHVKWLIGRKFEAYIAVVGLERAVPVLAAATTAEAPYVLTPASSYPVEVATASGRIDVVVGSLRHTVARESPALVDAFAEAMRASKLSGSDADRLVAAMVRLIRHPEAWSGVLHAAAENFDVIGRAFVPTLLAGGLFIHSGTRESACALVRAAVPRLSPSERHVVDAAIRDLPADIADRIAELIVIAEPLPPTVVDADEAAVPLPEQVVDDPLRQAIDAASVEDADPSAVGALEAELWRTVHDGPDERTASLVIWAADLLVTHRRPDPGTPLGELVVKLCLAAAETESPEDGALK